MTARVVVLSNPHAAGGARQRERDEIARIVRPWGDFMVPDGLPALDRCAAALSGEPVDIIAIHGGDGTIHAALTALDRAYGPRALPKLALLNGGTLNTIARGTKLRGRPVGLACALKAIYDRGHAPTRPANVLGIGERVGFIFGNGIVASFLRAYYESPRPNARTGAALVTKAVAAAAFRTPFASRLFERVKGRVLLDGAALPQTEHLTVAAATVPEIGLGFAPFIRCNDDSSKFALTCVRCSPVALCADLPRLRFGKGFSRRNATSEVAATVDVEPDGAMSYTIDGDLYETRDVLRIRIARTLDLVDWASLRGLGGG